MLLRADLRAQLSLGLGEVSTPFYPPCEPAAGCDPQIAQCVPCPLERAYGGVQCCVLVSRPMVSMKGEWFHQPHEPLAPDGGHSINMCAPKATCTQRPAAHPRPAASDRLPPRRLFRCLLCVLAAAPCGARGDGLVIAVDDASMRAADESVGDACACVQRGLLGRVPHGVGRCRWLHCAQHLEGWPGRRARPARARLAHSRVLPAGDLPALSRTQAPTQAAHPGPHPSADLDLGRGPETRDANAHPGPGRGPSPPLQAISDLDEALVCPNPHSPRSWTVCGDLGRCTSPVTRMEALSTRKALQLSCLDVGLPHGSLPKGACAPGDDYFVANMCAPNATPPRRTPLPPAAPHRHAARRSRLQLHTATPPAATAHRTEFGTSGLFVSCFVRVAAGGGEEGVCLPPLTLDDIALVFTPTEAEMIRLGTNDPAVCGYNFIPYATYEALQAKVSPPLGTRTLCSPCARGRWSGVGCIPIRPEVVAPGAGLVCFGGIRFDRGWLHPATVWRRHRDVI
jgi:hypothetical protein